MKKLLLFLLLLASPCLGQFPFPPGQPYQLVKIATCVVSGASTVCTPSLTQSIGNGFFTATGIGYYKLSWTVDGSFTSCAVSIDSNSNRLAAWTVGGVASTGTVGSCATQGAYHNTVGVFVNLARITPAIVCSAPGCTVTFTLLGGLFPFSG